MRVAVIEDGLVANVKLCDESYQLSANEIDGTDAQIGDRVKNGAVTRPPTQYHVWDSGAEDWVVDIPARTAALIAYANSVQWAKAQGGILVDYGNGLIVPFPTDDIGLVLINGAVSRLSQADAPSTMRWQVGPTDFVTLTAAQVVQAGCNAADHIQATFDVLNQVMVDIAEGAITSEGEVDLAFNS